MKVTVNGVECEVKPSYFMNYDQVVAAAGLHGEPTVVYHFPRQGDVHRDGILHKGQAINVEEGMRFEAVHTGNA